MPAVPARAGPSHNDRLRAALAVALIHLVVGAALIRGFEVDVSRVADDALQVFNLPAPVATPPPPPPPPPPARDLASGEEGAAAPTALRARPKPIVAPTPKIRTPVPPRTVAPPVAAEGTKVTSGAGPTPGPGTGAGGPGTGTGAGGSGTGSGAGDAGEGSGAGPGRGTPARLLSGRITRRDYPRNAWREGLARRVGVRFTVGTNGRASACRVVATSGEDRIDAITCRTVEQTFRYEPARNGRGQPVQVEMVWMQVLWTERNPSPHRGEGDSP